jgi:hypothetical protein
MNLDLPKNIISGPFREKGRTLYMIECPICKKHIKIRREIIHTIKSCFSCHHKVKRPDKPDGDVTWCSKCKQWKPSDLFYNRTDGTGRPCKHCETSYRIQNMKKINAYSKIYRRKNINKSMLFAARARAKQNKLPFDLDVNDIIVPETCPILNIPISTCGDKRNSPSLDRIIPDLGYVKGNIRVVSWRANWIKNNMTKEEVEKLYIDSKKWGCSGSKSVKKGK